MHVRGPTRERCELGAFQRRGGRSESSTVGWEDKSMEGVKDAPERMCCVRWERVWVVGEVEWSARRVDFETQDHMLR